MAVSETLTVLMIEDDPDDVVLVRESIRDVRDVSVRLQHADRLSSGLTELANGGVDVVLLDMMLPDSQGLETVLRTLSETESRSIPIVILSGLDDTRMAMEAIHLGAQDYVVKGQMSGVELVRSMRYATERARIRADLRSSHRFIEQIAIIVYMYNLSDLRMVYGNPQFLFSLDIEPKDSAQVIGRPVGEFLLPGEKEGELRAHRDGLSTAKDGEVLEIEVRINAAEAGGKWLLCKESVFSRKPDGTPERILGTAQDVSRYKRREQELRKANEKLAQKIKLLGETKPGG